MLLRSAPRLFRLVAGLFACLAVLLTGCSSTDTRTNTGAATSASPSSAPA